MLFSDKCIQVSYSNAGNAQLTVVDTNLYVGRIYFYIQGYRKGIPGVEINLPTINGTRPPPLVDSQFLIVI